MGWWPSFQSHLLPLCDVLHSVSNPHRLGHQVARSNPDSTPHWLCALERFIVLLCVLISSTVKGTYTCISSIQRHTGESPVKLL